MIGTSRAVRVLYETPAPLTGTSEAMPEEIRRAMEDDVDQLLKLNGGDVDLVAVQGQVSSMKTWLLTCTAEAFIDRAHRVVALAPQRVNRRSLVERLALFDVPFIEHPSRLDLCVWSPWRDIVGQVDERTCSTNGCPMYPADQNLEELAMRALEIHLLETGGEIQLDVSTVKELATQLDESVCPHYLLDAMAEIASDKQAVRVATYAKAFKSDDSEERLAADVALLDENHTVAADTTLATSDVDLPSIRMALTDVFKLLDGSANKRSREIARDLEPLEWALEDWEKESRQRSVNPGELFSETTLTAESVFGALHRADDAIMNQLSRAVRTRRPRRAKQLNEARTRLRTVTEFFSRVQAHNEGEFDFVHTRYEARGEVVNEMTFRRVCDRDAACTPFDVYEAWCDEGTHPAIARRWGDLLDHYIEMVWAGRAVIPGGDRVIPGASPSPLADLRSITGTDTLVGYSATHNEASDPSRSADDPRQTAHRLVSAPLQLRSDGDDRTDYHGNTAVDAATPWFRDIVQRAKAESGARIAAVPTNSRNAEKWAGMPVEELGLPDGQGRSRAQSGIVPHSRAAIGDKGLEGLPIDAVLCGVQVQSPADTARQLIELWELLASDHDDPTAVVEKGWRLLAQRAVSGTIQAAGRFRPSATNIVFERPELIELAGFEHEPLSASIDGFVGEFARLLEDVKTCYEGKRDAVRAAKIVRYLERSPSKAPTRTQYYSTYSEVYDGTKEEATEAFEAAAARGTLEYVAGSLRTVRDAESGGK